MSTLQEALSLVDEVAKELFIYEANNFRPNQEQTALGRCKECLELIWKGVHRTDPDGISRAEKMPQSDWRRLAALVRPLATCFMVSGVTSTAKAKLSSATALAVLALLSSYHDASKVILAAAMDSGVVDACVNTLRQYIQTPDKAADRVMRAVLYKLIDTLRGFTLYNTPDQQKALVGREVVDVCLELVTCAAVEPESKLLASKTLYNILITPGHVVQSLRKSKVTALNATLQALALQVPDPVAAASGGGAGAGGGGGGGAGGKTISMPSLLPSIMQWVWFLPDYIVDHLIDSLTLALQRVVVLVWPEGHPGIPILAQQQQQQPGGAGAAAAAAAAGGGDAGAPPAADSPRDTPGSGPAPGSPVLAGPLQVAQQSLPNRYLRATFQNLIEAYGSGLADWRLLQVLRGSRLPDAAAAAAATAAPGAPAAGLRYHLALPARLIRVVRQGRASGMEVRIALELLDEMLGCSAKGLMQLADDALAAGLVRAMGELAAFTALHTEAGLAGLAAFVRLAVKLTSRAASDPSLSAQLVRSGVPATVAYLAFMPGSKLVLRLEALQALLGLARLGSDLAASLVELPNFPVALTNTLLGGDPDVRKPPKKPTGPPAKGKKGTAAAAAAATDVPPGRGGGTGLPTSVSVADGTPAGGVDGGGGGGSSELVVAGARSLREQMQEGAVLILAEVLQVARHDDQVWTTVLESCLLPRLLQHCPAFSMRPGLLAEALKLVELTFTDHQEDVVRVGALQAACAPHLLPLLALPEPPVALAAARLLLACLQAMARYRRDATDLDQGDDILKALVAAGAAAIDGADEVAVARAAVEAAAAAGWETGRVGGAVNGAAVPHPPASAVGLAGPAPALGLAAQQQQPKTAGVGMDLVMGPGGGDGGVAQQAVAGPPGAVAPSPAPSDIPELVDVTAQGLGLICTAVQMHMDLVLSPSRPLDDPTRSGGSSPPPAPSAGPSTVSTTDTTALDPAALPSAAATAAAGSAAAAAAPLLLLRPVLDGAPGEALEVLLTCALLLCEACFQMPAHAHLRRHIARAFAYLAPPVDDLAAAVTEVLAAALAESRATGGGRGGGGPGAREVEQCRRLGEVVRSVRRALRLVPVLDVARLPKPQPILEVAKEPVAALQTGPPRRGRPPGSSNKRNSQTSLDAGAAASPQKQSKRPRTAAAAAAAAAAASAATAAGVLPSADRAAAPPAAAAAAASVSGGTAAGASGGGSGTPVAANITRSRSAALVAEGQEVAAAMAAAATGGDMATAGGPPAPTSSALFRAPAAASRSGPPPGSPPGHLVAPTPPHGTPGAPGAAAPPPVTAAAVAAAAQAAAVAVLHGHGSGSLAPPGVPPPPPVSPGAASLTPGGFLNGSRIKRDVEAAEGVPAVRRRVSWSLPQGAAVDPGTDGPAAATLGSGGALPKPATQSHQQRQPPQPSHSSGSGGGSGKPNGFAGVDLGFETVAQMGAKAMAVAAGGANSATTAGTAPAPATAPLGASPPPSKSSNAHPIGGDGPHIRRRGRPRGSAGAAARGTRPSAATAVAAVAVTAAHEASVLELRREIARLLSELEAERRAREVAEAQAPQAAAEEGAAAAPVAPAAGAGPATAAMKNRVLELKAQNARLLSELEAERRAREEAESRAVRAAAAEGAAEGAAVTAAAAATPAALAAGAGPATSGMKARILELRAQNARLLSELEAERRAREEAELLVRQAEGAEDCGRRKENEALKVALAETEAALQRAAQAAMREAAARAVAEAAREEVQGEVTRLRVTLAAVEAEVAVRVRENERLALELQELNEALM